ncbi:hypothetical protein KXS07_13990 [Inquilinus limosus]|uniref:hypothetical protein n=1 Tax=Inquilinus limosus TaxID=171674 RepID=UPI003F18F8F2
MAALSTGDLLRGAVGWSLGHTGALARLSAPAIAFALILRFAIDWLWGDDVEAMFAASEASSGATAVAVSAEASMATGVLAMALSMLVVLLTIALIAVAWHRYVLRGEFAPFPADAATLRFALYQIWLGILGLFTATAGVFVLSILFGLVGGPSLMQALAAGGPSGNVLALLVATAVLTALATVPFAFYGLVLPAIAIGDRGLTGAESSRLLRGHRLQAWAALAVASLTFLVIAYGLGAVLAAILPAETGIGVATLLADLVSLVLTAVEVSVFAGVLSELYRALRVPELARGGVPE